MKENAIDSIACVSFALSDWNDDRRKRSTVIAVARQSETSMVGRSSLTNGYERLDAFAE